MVETFAVVYGYEPHINHILFYRPSKTVLKQHAIVRSLNRELSFVYPDGINPNMFARNSIKTILHTVADKIAITLFF